MKTQKQTINNSVCTHAAVVAPPMFQTGKDLAVALMIVSLLFNGFVAITWIMVQLTSQYDGAIAQMLLLR